MTVYCRYFQKTYCVVTRHTAYLLIKSNETVILHRKLYISIMKKTSVCTKFKIFGNYSFLKNSFLPLNISVTKKIASLKNDIYVNTYVIRSKIKYHSYARELIHTCT